LPHAKIERRRFYRPELDVLRFFAFLAVFLHHALPGFELTHHSGPLLFLLRFENVFKEAGGFGVCLFFLLSAYLITELLERERQTVGSIHVRSFYARRILRIWPLYFLFLFAAVLLGLAVQSYRVEPHRIWAFLLLAGNWYVASTSCGGSPIAPLWSISVEEQFYLSWPWIAKAGRSFVFWLSVLLLPIAWLTLFGMSHGASPNRTIWVNSFVQFQFFAFGALLALGFKSRLPQLKATLRVVLVSGGVLSWIIVSGIFRIEDDLASPTGPRLVAGYTLVALGCVLLFIGFLGARIPFSSPLAYLGKISYGLYVFHMLALDLTWKIFAPAAHSEFAPPGSTWILGLRFLVIQVVAMLITILLASISYRLLERPFLGLKGRFTLVKSRLD
jgi:peptidoglycan/LPS O-acetylase OafA/YrhL